MRLRTRTVMAFLAWAASAVPGRGLAAGEHGVAGCERQFAAQPDDPESARCFWRQADKLEAARRVRKLLVRYPRNPGLMMCSAVLEPTPPDHAEMLLRSAAGEYFHRRDAAGEVLAKENLVLLLLSQQRIDEASREVTREDAAALAVSPRWRNRDRTMALISQASLLFNRGDLERASLLLDKVPPGPLRDEHWLKTQGNVHLFTGQTDRAWSDCLQLLSLPGLSYFQRANGLYCEVKVVVVVAVVLPTQANVDLLESTARAAQSQARIGDNRNAAALASWLLVILAR